MAMQSLTERRELEPIVHVGAPDTMIRDMFDSLARRAFSIFESNGSVAGRELDDWFRAENELFHPAHVEMSESGNAFTVRAEVPGFSPKDLDINVEGRRLTITGTRCSHEEHREKKMVYSETCSNKIFRVVDLPAEVNAETAKATLKDGMLELELPKASPAKRVTVVPEARAA